MSRAETRDVAISRWRILNRLMVPRGPPFAVLFCARVGHSLLRFKPAAGDEAVASSDGGLPPLMTREGAPVPCRGPVKDRGRERKPATHVQGTASNPRLMAQGPLPTGRTIRSVRGQFRQMNWRKSQWDPKQTC